MSAGSVIMPIHAPAVAQYPQSHDGIPAHFGALDRKAQAQLKNTPIIPPDTNPMNAEKHPTPMRCARRSSAVGPSGPVPPPCPFATRA